MILTGRTGLIALICALPIALSAWPATSFLVLLIVLAVGVIADIGWAASPSQLQYTRMHNGSVRLGEAVNTGLLIHNAGRRRFRGQVRDAWAPSARAEPASHAVDIAAGQVQRVDTCLRPVRRGDQRSAAVTARSIGPLGLAGRQRSRPVPGQVRVLPPFLSRKHLPSRLAKLREIDGLLPTLTRGQGTEFDSLREYVVGDDVRLDWRAWPVGPRGADVAARNVTGASSSCSTRTTAAGCRCRSDGQRIKRLAISLSCCRRCGGLLARVNYLSTWVLRAGALALRATASDSTMRGTGLSDDDRNVSQISRDARRSFTKRALKFIPAFSVLSSPRDRDPAALARYRSGTRGGEHCERRQNSSRLRRRGR